MDAREGNDRKKTQEKGTQHTRGRTVLLVLYSAMFAFVVASLLLVARVSGQAAPDVCWKDTWDRGVGTIPDSCDASEVRGVWPGAPGSCGEGLPVLLQ